MGFSAVIVAAGVGARAGAGRGASSGGSWPAAPVVRWSAEALLARRRRRAGGGDRRRPARPAPPRRWPASPAGGWSLGGAARVRLGEGGAGGAGARRTTRSCWSTTRRARCVAARARRARCSPRWQTRRRRHPGAAARRHAEARGRRRRASPTRRAARRPLAGADAAGVPARRAQAPPTPPGRRARSRPTTRMVVERAGGRVALVPGDPALDEAHLSGGLRHGRATGRRRRASIRVGQGFDAHRFGPGDGVCCAACEIAHDQALVGHSDADAGLHALTDALLGAIGDGDIGDHFPPTRPAVAGRRLRPVPRARRRSWSRARGGADRQRRRDADLRAAEDQAAPRGDARAPGRAARPAAGRGQRQGHHHREAWASPAARKAWRRRPWRWSSCRRSKAGPHVHSAASARSADVFARDRDPGPAGDRRRARALACASSPPRAAPAAWSRRRSAPSPARPTSSSAASSPIPTAPSRSMLGVSGDLIADLGAVSEPIVRMMAEGALENSHAHVSVAITGVAGPGGGTPMKPVGTVHFATARANQSVHHRHGVLRARRPARRSSWPPCRSRWRCCATGCARR